MIEYLLALIAIILIGILIAVRKNLEIHHDRLKQETRDMNHLQNKEAISKGLEFDPMQAATIELTKEAVGAFQKLKKCYEEPKQYD